MKITNGTKIVRSKNQEHSYLDEEIVMMNIENGNYYNFNQVGTRVWELIEETPLTVEELANIIITEFAVEKDRCISDIIKFADYIKEQGLLEVSPNYSN